MQPRQPAPAKRDKTDSLMAGFQAVLTVCVILNIDLQ